MSNKVRTTAILIAIIMNSCIKYLSNIKMHVHDDKCAFLFHKDIIFKNCDFDYEMT